MPDAEREAMAEPTTDDEAQAEAEGRFMRREWLSIATFSIAMTLLVAIVLLVMTGLVDLPAEWVIVGVIAVLIAVGFGWIRYRQALAR